MSLLSPWLTVSCTPDSLFYCLFARQGPSNNAVTLGTHAEAFQSRIGKTQFLGRFTQDGSMWEAHGVPLWIL